MTLRPKHSSPMDRHLAPPISGSWSPGAARAVDGASLLHGPLRVDRTAETEKKVNGWTDRGWTQRQGTVWLMSESAKEVQSGGGPLPPEQEHTLSRAIYAPRDGSATLGAGDGNSGYNADHRWSLRLCRGTQACSVPERVGSRDSRRRLANGGC